MTRNVKLYTLTLGALAIITMAANTAPMSAGIANAMPAMHATATAHPHAAGSGMTQMHDKTMIDPAMHNALLNDPTMLAHLAAYDIDVDQMRRWHNEGRSLNEMHATLARQGIDITGMQAECPMGVNNDAMANMHSGPNSFTQMTSRLPQRGDPK